MNARALLFLAGGALLLLGLFVWFKPPVPAPAAAPAAEATLAAPAAVAPALPLQPKVFELVVRDGKVVAAPDTLRVSVGDEVELRVTSDRADELHLHGYDRSLELRPGVAAELRLLATRTGRFEIELHQAHLDLGALEVHPK